MRPLVAAAVAGLALGCRLGTEAPTPPAPQLVFSPESLAFHGRAGDVQLPYQFLALNVDANVSARFQSFENGDWLYLLSGGDTLPYFLPVLVLPGALPPGTYAASIWIEVGNRTSHIPVTLQLDTAASLSGRWVASQDSTDIVLYLTDSAGTVTGWGSMSPPVRQVTVTGTRSDTTVSLTLTAADATYRFTGLLVGVGSLPGALSGGGLAGLPLTLYRQ